MTPPRCPRCGRNGLPKRLYCSPACREADRTEHPQRLAAVLRERATGHEQRADELEQEGRHNGARALRAVAAAWRADADQIDPPGQQPPTAPPQDERGTPAPCP